jgi:hypothetical protein
LAKLGEYVGGLEPGITSYIQLCAGIDDIVRKNVAARANVREAEAAMRTAIGNLRRSFYGDLGEEKARYDAELSRETADQPVRRHKRIMGINEIEREAGEILKRLVCGGLPAETKMLSGRSPQEANSR